MARIRGPLHSQEAHGSFGKRMIFQSPAGFNRVGIYSTPTDRRTPGQLSVRNKIFHAVLGWQSLSPSEKAAYDILAKKTGRPLSGYNYFVQEYFDSFGYVPPGPEGPVQDQLIFWLKLDSAPGGITPDSADAHDGICSAISINPSGKINSCADFVSGTGKITISHHPDLVPSVCFTIEFWYKPKTCSDYSALLNKGDPGVGRFEIYHMSNNYIVINDSSYYRNLIASPLILNEWHHHFFIWNLPTGEFNSYRDNVLDQHYDPGTPWNIGTSTNNLIIGARWDDYSFIQGMLDEYRYYKKCLSAEERLQNFSL